MAVAAPAEATWSPQSTVPGSDDVAGFPLSSLVSGSAAGLVGWLDSNDRPVFAGVNVVTRKATRAKPRFDVGIGEQGGVVAYGASRLLAAGPSLSDERLAIQFGRIGGGIGAPRVIGTPRREAKLTRVAGNASGRLAILSATRPSVGPSGPLSLELRLRRPGGQFGAPTALAPTGSIGPLDVAVAPDGGVVAAWERQGKVEGVVVSPAGKLTRVALATDGAHSLSVAAESGGRAAFVWTTAGGPSSQVVATVRTATGSLKSRRLGAYDASVPCAGGQGAGVFYSSMKPVAVWTAGTVGKAFVSSAALLAGEAGTAISSPETSACLGAVASNRNIAVVGLWEPNGGGGRVSAAVWARDRADFDPAIEMPGARAFGPPKVAIFPRDHPVIAWRATSVFLSFYDSP
jgi:hypothetical protein